MIKYAYCGKIYSYNTELSKKLYEAAVKYQFSHLESQSLSPVSLCKAVTRIKTQEISFRWSIRGFSSFTVGATIYSDVFYVDRLSSCKWQLSLSLMNYSIADQTFEISLHKMTHDDNKPNFVKSRIFVPFCGHTFPGENFFMEDEIWKCAEIKSIEHSDLELNCDFVFSDFSKSTETKEICCDSSFFKCYVCYCLSTDMKNLLKDQTHWDVKILVHDTTIYAHKAILSARSAFFLKMFQNEKVESKYSSIEIPKFSVNVVNAVLLYMYSGRLELALDYSIAEELYAAASECDVNGLKKRCARFLKSNVTLQNFCNILFLADTHRNVVLYQATQRFFFSNKDEILQTGNWKNFMELNSKLVAKFLQELLLKCSIKRKKKNVHGTTAKKV